MSEKQKFTATIEDAEGGGAFVRIPFDVEEVFGQKRVKVKATINGESYRGMLVKMGMPYHVLIVLKEIREKIGKSIGDKVQVTVEEDTEPRLVEVPPDFLEALELEPEAKAAFEKMSYTHRKEYVRSILEAKRPETRQSRIKKNIVLLKEKSKGR